MINNNKYIVCFDTNIYENSQYNFDGKFYSVLKKLKNSTYPYLEIYLDPIIHAEVKKHIKEKSKDLSNEVESFSKKIDNFDIFKIVSANLKIENLEDSIYEEYYNKFMEFINIFSNKPVEAFPNYDMNEILNDYFNSKPPFENEKSKKHEFPDALIIQTLYKNFSKEINFCVVSNDQGFLNAVKSKLPNANIFKNYSLLTDFLNQQLEDLTSLKSSIRNVLPQINKHLSNHLYNLSFQFTDHNNFLKYGVSLSHSMSNIYKINNFVLNNNEAIINILNYDDNTINARIIFPFSISFTKRNVDTLQNISEQHYLKYPVDITLDKSNPLNFSITPEKIELNYDTIDNFHEDYFPSLHSTHDTYRICCEECNFTSEFFTPDISEFDISNYERSMGDETLYSITTNEICEHCSCPLITEIEIAVYPYLIINDISIKCSGGEVFNLDFEIS